MTVYCHAGCSRADIFAELRRRGLTVDAPLSPRIYREIRRPTENDDATRRIALARRIWEAARDAHGTPVVAYFGGRRITISPPPSLRWMRALRRLDGSCGPAMVARIDDIDGKLIGIARTWLVRDDRGIWRRRDRAMLGCAAGGAVRLAPVAETLQIGEGIESCLSAMQATAMPAWAALSTAGMVTLVLLSIVQVVIILVDNDANGAGERAAYAAADRWLAQGRLAMPPQPDTDFNDVLCDVAT